MTLSYQTETQVQLKGVHLCCEGCTNAVIMAVRSVPGAACQCDMEHGTVTVTARDDAAAQQALDAIAAAGFYGETGDTHLAMTKDRDLPAGKVQRARVTGIHNCCDLCYNAIQGAIDSVAGVTGDTAAPGKVDFDVTGDFSASALLQALHAAGFHARVR